MNTLYNFATGPLAWLAFVVCIGGIIWRLWSYALLARMRDGSALAYIRPKYSLISFFRWTVPTPPAAGGPIPALPWPASSCIWVCSFPYCSIRATT